MDRNLLRSVDSQANRLAFDFDHADTDRAPSITSQSPFLRDKTSIFESS